ncbi:STAS domain-containing protein [Streptacidiphilus rugosus]|uniref:STAS domain-containing protein n=1 Tax=Streptacidiphilus rugosus TaxID=405783 RepID=UPI0018DD500A|nr:STAS domain-containing protein [Streptacidiphilus rugosus]
MRAAGELDWATTPALRARLQRELESHPGGVVVDLTRVTFADCAALGTLIAARNHAAELGRRLKLRGTPPPVTRLLKATGTYALFPQDA